MPARPPPCGTKGLVAPQDIATGLVSVASALHIAQTSAGIIPFDSWTPQQVNNATLENLGRPLEMADLNGMAQLVVQYVTGTRDTFPVCVQAEPSDGRGVLIGIGVLLLFLLAKRH